MGLKNPIFVYSFFLNEAFWSNWYYKPLKTFSENTQITIKRISKEYFVNFRSTIFSSGFNWPLFHSFQSFLEIYVNECPVENAFQVFQSQFSQNLIQFQNYEIPGMWKIQFSMKTVAKQYKILSQFSPNSQCQFPNYLPILIISTFNIP